MVHDEWSTTMMLRWLLAVLVVFDFGELLHTEFVVDNVNKIL